MMNSNFFLFYDFTGLNILHCQKQREAIVFLLSVAKHTHFGLTEIK